IAVLLALAVLMAVIGAVALSSTMSTSVLERGRELAVLRAIGARPAQVRRLVLLESLFVTALSLPLAVALGAPLAMIVGTVIGELSFRIPLPLTLSLPAIAGWSLGSLLVAVLASVVPARAATRPTVREALGRV
ncbi:MAG: FtsX-like permease family protein, partial [Myxococcales bacterium]|nr:FtsX-like permease family protein [Myxococcales bacterium]